MMKKLLFVAIIFALLGGLFGLALRCPYLQNLVVPKSFDSAVAVHFDYYWAAWCDVCKTQTVIMRKLKSLGYTVKKHEDITPTGYFPTVQVMRNGKVFKTNIGITSHQKLAKQYNEAQKE